MTDLVYGGIVAISLVLAVSWYLARAVEGREWRTSIALYAFSLTVGAEVAVFGIASVVYGTILVAALALWLTGAPPLPDALPRATIHKDR